MPEEERVSVDSRDEHVEALVIAGEKIIQDFCTDTPDAIFMTSGGVVKQVDGIPGQVDKQVLEGGHTILDEDQGRMRTARFHRGYDPKFFAWGSLRVVATVTLVERLRSVGKSLPKLLTCSTAINNASSLSDAQVGKDELLAKTGLEDHDVTPLPESFDTFSELLVGLSKAVDMNAKHVGFISFEPQIPRIQAMLHSLTHLQDPVEREKVERMMRYNERRIESRLTGKTTDEKAHLRDVFRNSLATISAASSLPRVDLIPSEEVVATRSDHHATAIAEAIASDRYQSQIGGERSAAESWRNNTYALDSPAV